MVNNPCNFGFNPNENIQTENGHNIFGVYTAAVTLQMTSQNIRSGDSNNLPNSARIQKKNVNGINAYERSMME